MQLVVLGRLPTAYPPPPLCCCRACVATHCSGCCRQPCTGHPAFQMRRHLQTILTWALRSRAWSRWLDGEHMIQLKMGRRQPADTRSRLLWQASGVWPHCALACSCRWHYWRRVIHTGNENIAHYGSDAVWLFACCVRVGHVLVTVEGFCKRLICGRLGLTWRLDPIWPI